VTKTNPPATLGIRHLALKTPDVERAERFYCDILGYTVEWRPDPENVYLTAGRQDNLAIHKDANAASGGALDHFGIMLRSAEDVDAWAAHLKAHGVRLLKEPKTHRDGARSFYTADPDGVVIQFIHHPPIADAR
jgi:catechol 2,3-dioxygenase-like lactoylglutathione lyase family enzyme